LRSCYKHPFLIGDTALRVSAKLNKPVIFTYHTLYKNNTHYFFGGSKVFTNFVVKLSVGYVNFCDRIVAPSQSIADFLRRMGVQKHIDVIPTGVRIEDFKAGDAPAIREIVKNKQNGRIVRGDSISGFVSALGWIARQPFALLLRRGIIIIIMGFVREPYGSG
jgi:glycosyltransferase involved in cell wall biosynthesis